MQAILRVALNADTLPVSDRDHRKHEKVNLVGEGSTWDEAKTAALAQVPEGALMLHWIRAE